MPLLTVANLTYSIADLILLDGVNLNLEPGEHVGLVGRNGCGKSTLLKIIAGQGHKPDAGQIQLTRNASVGYLSQHHDLDPEKTLREEAATAFGRLDDLHRQLEETYHELESASGDDLDRLMKKAERLDHEVQAAGGYTVEHQIDTALHGLGLTDEFFDVKVKDLSGGQRGRLALAKLLLAGHDVLLLDEPTNHLDIAGREWLEEYLRSYVGAVILVSHDRWLLDRAVDAIYELELGALEQYPGNFEKYKELRAERRLAQMRMYEKQQTKIKQEQAFIDRYRAGQRARQAQGREKRLERFKDQQLIEAPVELSNVNINFKPGKRSGDIVARANAISKSYDDKTLFHDLSLQLMRGERIGIIGPNGAGKSTLVRCLLGEQETDDGTLQLGSAVDVGYYRQAHENLDLSLTVVEYLQRQVPSGSDQEARNLAGAFLFSGLEQDKPLSVLSGGERSRAVLAGLMVKGHNTLVLDEPTNHLDIQSAERLEEALREFVSAKKGYGGQASDSGTLILITHDRMLLEHLVDQLLILDGEGNTQIFQGTYSKYHDSLAEKTADDAGVRFATAGKTAGAMQTPPKAAPPASPKPVKAAPPKGARPEKTNIKGPRVATGALARLNQKELERRIEVLETEKATIDEELLDPDLYKDGDKVKAKQARRSELETELTPLEEEWARRAEEQ